MEVDEATQKKSRRLRDKKTRPKAECKQISSRPFSTDVNPQKKVRERGRKTTNRFRATLFLKERESRRRTWKTVEKKNSGLKSTEETFFKDDGCERNTKRKTKVTLPASSLQRDSQKRKKKELERKKKAPPT